MPNKHYRFVYLFFITLIGLTSTYFELIYRSQKGNHFNSLSPLPIVFSIGLGGKPKEISNRIYYSVNGKEKELSLNDQFYKSLGGPHHYRLLFMLKLKRSKYIFRSSFPDFLQKSFCGKKLIYFKDIDIDYVRIALNSDENYLNIRCK